MAISTIFEDPELVQALTEAGVYPDQLDLFEQQMKRAQALRGTPMAQGQNVGHTYVASSPLEHLAVAMQRVQGQRDTNKIQQGQDDLLRRMRANAAAVAQALRNQQQPQPTQQYGPPEPPDWNWRDPFGNGGM